MTKLRPPLTPCRALQRIADLISWDEAARIVGRSKRTVMRWSEPDVATGITFAAAIELDTAYVAAGGHGALLLAAYEAQLKGRLARSARPIVRLAVSLGRAAKEMGDSAAAGFRAIAPGAGRAELNAAKVEAAEAVEALHEVIADVDAALDDNDAEAAGVRR